ncbi:putative pumilio-like 7, chloroplastic [Vitis vinifera]|uniref:Putative pumilio-like 7, chloroplastic n=1 Tax=Vitis vinifera TaxID=29760 RepID=A0A438DDR6_VITVI|nr:putative pumilio-like 7, chloroplastic [Vitis vinifera]
MEGSMQKTPSSSSSSVSGCSSSSYCCSMSGSRNTVNAVLLAGFRELFNRTEDQSDDNSVSSSQNQPVLPTGLEQSAVPDAQFSTSFSPNNIWAWPGLRNEGSYPGSNGQSFVTGNPDSSAAPASTNWGNQSEARTDTGSSQDNVLPQSLMMVHHNLNPTLPREDSPPDPHPPETGTDYSAQIQSMQPCQIIEMALNFSGSFLLRSALAEKKPESKSTIFEGLIAHIVTLAVHPSGCNVFIRLTEACDANQLSQILSKLILPPSTIIRVSHDPIGSKSIQRLIQVLRRSPLVVPVVTALAAGFYELMKDQQGAMVISRCLALLSSEQNEELYRAAILPCVALATHAKGCIALNSFINNVIGPYRDLLLHKITDNTVFLSQDPRGNFVVQHILELHHPVFTSKICHLLQGYYVRLSVQKSGSHIVEKCLKSHWMSFAVKELTTSGRLPQLAHDQFGNYVIQTALRVTKDANIQLYRSLLEALEPYLPSLASHLHGKNLFRLINNRTPI